MSFKQIRQTILSVSAASMLLVGGTVAAQTSSSNNYKVDEYYFGTGGELDSTSANYRAQSSVGALGVGDATSANYDATAGFLTPEEPFLEVIVSGATVNFGDISDTVASSGAAQAGACNCSFTVRSYRSSAYTVVTISNPPTNESGFSLNAKGTLGVPSVDPNVEEFGINVVDNASPNIGGNPVNQPDNTFADGEAAPGYNTPDQFKYGVGDIIARSAATVGTQAVGKTEYTVSYIAKRNNMTRAGLYVMKHDFVVVSTY